MIALLMFLENVFPPIPSEVIMPLAGSSATDGRLSIIGVIAAGSAGSLAGALLWYAIGRKLEDERIKRWSAKHGRWLTLDQMTSKKPRTGSENTAQKPSSCSARADAANANRDPGWYLRHAAREIRPANLRRDSPVGRCAGLRRLQTGRAIPADREVSQSAHDRHLRDPRPLLPLPRDHIPIG